MSKDCLYSPEEPLIEEALDALPEFQAPPALLTRLVQLTEKHLAERASQGSGIRLCREAGGSARSAASSSASSVASSAGGAVEATAPFEDAAQTDAPEHGVGSATGLPPGIAEILSTLVTESGGLRFLLKTAVVSVTVGLSFGTTLGICARLPGDPSTSPSSDERAYPVWRER